MFEEQRFNKFTELMESEIIKHDSVYQESWKHMDLGLLQHRLKSKMNEFVMTKNPNKLVSLSNLAMILHVRTLEEYNR